MKINIACKSPILQKTLHLYLKEYCVSYEDCDFVITDNINEDITKPICLVAFSESSDIRRPIYRQSLFDDLEKFHKRVSETSYNEAGKLSNILDIGELENLKKSLDFINNISSDDDEQLKNNIENLLKDYTLQIYEIIKNHPNKQPKI